MLHLDYIIIVVQSRNIYFRGVSIKPIFIFFIIVLSFQGCSNKQPEVMIKETILQGKISDKNVSSSDEFSDEFEDEFSDDFTDETKSHYNPFDAYNLLMTSINDDMIIHVINPISKVYDATLPQQVRIGISNAIHNIKFPIRFTNNLLQGKFQNVSEELGRFLINSTFGLAGFMDPAKEYKGLLPHDEDFGQTLGFYDVEPGYHIVLPFLGPSNVRDLVGIAVDAYASPLVNVRGLENYKIPQNFVQSAGVYTGYIINENSLKLGQYESLKKDALGLYPFLRDIYEQKRVTEIEE